MATAYRCREERRHQLVRTTLGPDQAPLRNGIDYLEVGPQPTSLDVHFIHPLPGQQGAVPAAAPLTASSVRIEGGVRITGIQVLQAAATGTVLSVELDKAGDFSTYRLRLVDGTGGVPAGYDEQLAEVEFSFMVNCPSEFDCRPVVAPRAPELPSPPIDYLAKDYASFRQLMLDRLTTLLPDWTERNPADLWVTLAELLGYAADELSYYQDAVATEAYLGTARRRTSIRRHARLVDYVMHDGANARAWVCLEVSRDLLGSTQTPALPAGTPVLSRSVHGGVTILPSEYPTALAEAPTVFETLHPVPALRVSRNAIRFHTWGDRRCCLPRGATQASLVGSTSGLGLAAGDVLVIEQIHGAQPGQPADPSSRHVVRLDRPPVERVDSLTEVTVLEVSWPERDALPFSLCVEVDAVDGQAQPAIVARGNVVLADHGRTVSEPLDPPVGAGRQRRAVLERAGLTHAMPYDHRRAVTEPVEPAAATTVDLRAVTPVIRLTGAGEQWHPRRDLLASDRYATDFVVEMEDDGRAHLRFGDGTFGRRPVSGELTADYRVGSGPGGNVGAEALGQVVTAETGITAVWNPLPAQGGTAPEEVEQVRLRAPQAFRTQERAVTEADYVAAAQRHPDVQRAAATRRWTGSWHTMFVTVDRRDGRPVDPEFEGELRAFLERFRLAGYDLEIDAPRFVPLDIALTIVVQPGHLRPDVKRALLAEFAAADLPDGRRGFFHPDNLSFGQPVYLSQIVTTAMAVPGVARVDSDDRDGAPNRFRRWGQPALGELAAGRISLSRLEIARLDNDANAPENGRIDFFLRGGL